MALEKLLQQNLLSVNIGVVVRKELCFSLREAMHVVTVNNIQRMWISKSTSAIGDMTKENYFSRSFNQNLYPLPHEIRPQSHLKTSVVVHKCN